MNLTPLRDLVLIRPDTAPKVTDSGLELVEHWKPEQTGVIASIAKSETELKVGDHVVFSWMSGSEFRIGEHGERILCLKSSDVLAVIE